LVAPTAIATATAAGSEGAGTPPATPAEAVPPAGDAAQGGADVAQTASGAPVDFVADPGVAGTAAQGSVGAIALQDAVASGVADAGLPGATAAQSLAIEIGAMGVRPAAEIDPSSGFATGTAAADFGMADAITVDPGALTYRSMDAGSAMDLGAAMDMGGATDFGGEMDFGGGTDFGGGMDFGGDG
jgi:hypothetical protein